LFALLSLSFFGFAICTSKFVEGIVVDAVVVHGFRYRVIA
jgi:hypothetical protein